MLGLTHIIENIICKTYDTEFKDNFILHGNSAMELSFNLKIDYDKEEGYRYLVIRLFGTGYVSVLSNETWIVAKDDEMHLENLKYDKGQSGWKFWGSHDSCWRDFVGKILDEYGDRLMNIKTILNWYKIIKLTEKELRIYRELEIQSKN